MNSSIVVLSFVLLLQSDVLSIVGYGKSSGLNWSTCFKEFAILESFLRFTVRDIQRRNCKDDPTFVIKFVSFYISTNVSKMILCSFLRSR